MNRILAMVAILLTASSLAAADSDRVRTMVVTGQVTTVYSNLHIVQGKGKPVCIHGITGSVRQGDIVVETCRLNAPENKYAWWESESVTRLGHADLPPPQDITLEQLVRNRPFFATVRTEGIIEDIQQDSTALNSFLITLRSGSSRIQATIDSTAWRRIQDFDQLMNAKVLLTGVYFDYISSSRPFHGPVFLLLDHTAIQIVGNTQSDLFNQPEFAINEAFSPNDIAELGLRTLSGTVLACWDKKYVLLKTKAGIHRLTLAFGCALPKVGAHIQIVGQPETDFYRINFTSVRYRFRPDAAEAKEPDYGTVNEGLSNLFRIADGKTVYKETAYGRLFHVRGTLTTRSDARLGILADGFQVDVDATSCPEALTALQPGSELDITGVCILDIDNWRPGTFQPPINGYRLVLRNGQDLAVFSVPSWWTPARFVSVIAGLFTLLVGTLIWNRTLNRLVVRRSRELLRERSAHMASELRIGERTRLAVELHDSLSQNLTGVTFQIAAARNAIGTADDTAKDRLVNAERVLKSCHTELRNVLSDLRSSALEEADFTDAIRTVLKGIADDADVEISFSVPRSRLMDSTAHTLLCIIRELVGNAIRHGKPSHVKIDGQLRNEGLVLDVREDGCGFDPTTCEGPAQGHFGLDGIRNRVQRVGGTFALDSAPGRGSHAVIAIPILANTDSTI